MNPAEHPATGAFLSLDGVSPELALRLGALTGELLVRAEAAGARAALTAAQRVITREARRGESGAPPRVQLTYAGGLRRAARALDPLLAAAAGAEHPTPPAAVRWHDEPTLPLFGGDTDG